MLPAGDAPLLAGGAALLDGAVLAGVGPVAPQNQPVFLVRIVVGEPFTGRTNVNVNVVQKSPSPSCGMEHQLGNPLDSAKRKML